MTATLTVVRDGDVATLRINRPPANAVTPDVIEEFLSVLPSLAQDPEVRCLVITGAGRFFIAGADIAVMRDLSEENHAKMRRWVDVEDQLERMPKPVIAAMNGHALGGGAELALACDLRVLASAATFGFPEMRLGLFPGAGGSQRLSRLVGPHLAKRLMIDAERLAAENALSLGLVDVVAADADFDDTVMAHAHRYAELPTATVGLLKRAVFDGYGRPTEDGLRGEWSAALQVIRTADAAEGLQAFLDKRPAEFSGR